MKNIHLFLGQDIEDIKAFYNFPENVKITGDGLSALSVNSIPVGKTDLVIIDTHGNVAHRGTEMERALSSDLFKEHKLLIDNVLEIQSKLQPKTYFIVSCHSGALVYDIERNADKFPVGTNFLIYSGSKYSITTAYSTSVDQSDGHNIINYVINEYPKTKDSLSLFNNNIQKYSETQNFVEIARNNETGKNGILAFKARAPKTIENVEKLINGEYLGTYAYHNDSEHKATNIVILRGGDTLEGYQKYIDSFNELKGVALEDYPYYSMNKLFSHRTKKDLISKNKYTNLAKELFALQEERQLLRSDFKDKWTEALSQNETNNLKELIKEFTKYNFPKDYAITSITDTFNSKFDKKYSKSFTDKKSTIKEKIESLNFTLNLALECGLLQDLGSLKLFAAKLISFAQWDIKNYVALKLSTIPGFESFKGDNVALGREFDTLSSLYEISQTDKSLMAKHIDSMYSKFNDNENIFNALISEKILGCCEVGVSPEELAKYYIDNKKAFKALTSSNSIECYKLGIKPIDLIPYVDNKEIFQLLTSQEARDCYSHNLKVQMVAVFLQSALYKNIENNDS
jgi:hypothetical protein